MSPDDEGYAVPKQAVQARFRLLGEEIAEGRIYLSETAQRHDGRELPSDVLNGDERFLPLASASDDVVRLVRRRSLLWVSAPLSAEDAGAATPVIAREDPEAASESVRIRFEDGSEVSGTLRWILPAGRRRVRDFLEHADPFFPLLAGERVTFVNRERVASVEIA